jgi:Tol biopolymer transport system component
MKKLDSSENGIFEISWSKNSDWIAYVRGDDEICIANVETGEIRVIGKGSSPCFNADNDILLEREGQIFLAGKTGEQLLFSTSDLVKNSTKRAPCTSVDGTKVVFVVNNVFDKESQNKNAYPYRHFLAIGEARQGVKPKLYNYQWYGGAVTWFPSGDRFVHFEYDSTGGARIHIVNVKGKIEGTMFGLYPSVSPDEKRIACKPKNGQNIVVYINKNDSWDKNQVETAVYKLPKSAGRLSASPPQWLDNRFVLVDEGDKIFRVDTRKEDSTEMKKLPVPTMRGKQTMAVSPHRELIAMEVESDGKFDLKLFSLI